MYYSVDPHSWPLQLLCELGLLGALILLACLGGVLLWLRRIFKGAQGSLAGGLCVAAILGSLVHAAFDFDYSFGATTALLGLLLAFGSSLAAPGRHSSAGPETAPAPPGPVGGTLRALRSGVAALLLLSLYWGGRLTLERMVLDSLRRLDIDQQLAQGAAAGPALDPRQARIDLLMSALRYNPGNHDTAHQLAAELVQDPSGSQRETALTLCNRAVANNPRFAQGFALRGLLRGGAEGQQDLQHAVELDPYNFPEHYFYWATLTEDETARRERLLLGMQRIPANDPIPPDHLRPQWHKLNAMFRQWWEELAQLTPEGDERRLYQQRADRFKDYIIKQRERKLQLP
jgi:hypothetical protein